MFITIFKLHIRVRILYRCRNVAVQCTNLDEWIVIYWQSPLREDTRTRCYTRSRTKIAILHLFFVYAVKWFSQLQYITQRKIMMLTLKCVGIWLHIHKPATQINYIVAIFFYFGKFYCIISCILIMLEIMVMRVEMINGGHNFVKADFLKWCY